METREFCSLLGIKMDIEGDLLLLNGFFLTSNKSTLDSRLFDEQIARDCGEARLGFFIKYPYFWKIFKGDNISDFTNENSDNFIDLKQFISMLWFVKDTSACLLESFLYNPTGEGHRVFSRQSLSINSDADGEHRIGTFTVDDLNYAKVINDKVCSITLRTNTLKLEDVTGKDNASHATPARYNYREYNEIKKIERALNFLSIARSHAYLPLKISFYVATLECLFNTSKEEVSYKTCERAAFYLNAIDKLTVFENLRTAYTIRSCFSHGQSFEGAVKTREFQKSLSVKIDDILRKILYKVIMEDSAIFMSDDKKEVTAFFNKMIFK